ncbi:MAG TPA: TerC family protein, partial [Chloroflexia bacterium]|nr:TerC family protein [Chloroflexia bacterium]
MEWLLNPDSLIALATLTLLEIVLGIDNIIFISILAGRLPKEQQGTARTIGLGLAMFTRILLLLSLSWIISLTAPLFALFGQEFSGRDLILLGGGLFLLAKATWEIHHRLEGEPDGHAAQNSSRARSAFVSTLVQIILLDIVFSLDSVITAVGMANELWVMITAVVIAVGIMMVSAGGISR